MPDCNEDDLFEDKRDHCYLMIPALERRVKVSVYVCFLLLLFCISAILNEGKNIERKVLKV